MDRQFDSIIKNITFNNVDDCKKETEKIIDLNKKLPQDYEKNPIIRISNRKELEEHIFPRIEFFHSKYSSKKYIVKKSNIFKESSNVLLSNKKRVIYTNSPSKQATYDTLDYIFDNFHSILFVQILNNKIYTFVLIDNQKSHLDMLKYIKVDPKRFKTKDDFMKYIQATRYKNRHLEKLQEDSIYFTDCSIHLWEVLPEQKEISRLWLYIQQYHMLVELLKHKKINDMEFCMNYKDRVVIEETGTYNPHYHLIGNLKTPLSKKIKKIIPILNVTGRKKFADIPIPTYDDWEICTNKIFLGVCRSMYFDIKNKINTNYDSKIPTAIFRGGATGCGTVIKNNPRLKVAYLSKKYYNHSKYGINNKEDGHLYLDARIVSFKKKVKKHYSDEYIQFIDPKKLNIKLGKSLPLSSITNYKYIISIEGNVFAYRLALELAYNSVILLVDSEFYTWYKLLLKPWIHYIPIKSDLSDLMEKIDWCKKNDSQCKKIAINATLFFKKYINENAIYDYMELILNE